MSFEKLYGEQCEEYEKRTPKSREIHLKAKKFMPGGDTRSITFFKPYPLFIKRGEGCRLFDVDDNTYIDFLNNYTATVHGHAFPPIVEAIKRQCEKCWVYAAGIESQYKLSEIICERIPSIEKVRYANSGSEGTMMAVRAARAFTRRDKILKMEGGYHGSHLSIDISVHPPLEKAGAIDSPKSIPESPGIPGCLVKDTLITPFNNKEVAEKIIRKNKKELAAVIVEPMIGAGGMIPPKDDYLKFLRETTYENDVLLIFDEVMMARMSVGGGQGFFGVTNPDLTTLGKMIGGYIPIGAFGGRADIMDMFSPEKPGFIPHSGTFNGNALAMEAGIAALKALTPDRIEKINSLGNSLKKKMDKVIEEEGIVGQVTGAASLYNFHPTPNECVDYRTVATENKQALTLLHLSMLYKGIFTAPRGMVNISTVMSQNDIDKCAVVFATCAKDLKKLK